MTRVDNAAWVLVTGATRNVGFDIAEEFALHGYCVVVHGQSGAERSAAQLLRRLPDACVVGIDFDLSDSTAIADGFTSLAERGISIGVLVNSAAHLGLSGAGSMDETSSLFRDVLEVNLFGTYHCTRYAVGHMAKLGGGSVINISSLAGQVSIPERVAYNTSKAALDGLTRSLAIDLANLGVRVNGIAPAYVWTERWNGVSDEERQRRLSHIPVGVPTTGREIGSVARFLASEAVPTLTGQVIVVDGGLSSQQYPPSGGSEAIVPHLLGSDLSDGVCKGCGSTP